MFEMDGCIRVRSWGDQSYHAGGVADIGQRLVDTTAWLRSRRSPLKFHCVTQVAPRPRKGIIPPERLSNNVESSVGADAASALEAAVRLNDAQRVRDVIARFPDITSKLDNAMPNADFGATPLIAAVLLLTYLLLLRVFRSLLLPLKAILLNLLSVGAAYGMLVVVFKWGAGESLFGLYRFGQVEGWIPIFLFAMLFGLSMDYEVFLVTRMREAWDETHDNGRAVGLGLERTGRIVTAAAIVMVAAFSGFVAGRVVGLQEFGLGLAVAIFVDATIVRALLVPSLMRLLGDWNWWAPKPLARLHRRIGLSEA